MKLSFVIPCYRSENTLEKVIEEIKSTVKDNDAYEVIMVSDHSPDNVYSVIEKLCKENPNFKGAELAKNFGQHSALMAGYSMCTGDIIITIDDDGQIPVDEVYSLIEKIEQGYDVVYGVYGDKKDSLFRRFGSSVNNKMTEWMINKPANLKATSYFAAKSFVIKEILKYKNAYPYIWGLIFRSTQNIGSVPVKHRARPDGTSGYTIKKLIALWVNGFTAFSVKPLRLATIIGIICAVIGFVVGLIMIIQKLIDPSIVAGYTSLISVILFIGGLIMLMLGLIGEYIGRIYICLNNSPQYVIRNSINDDTEDAIQ